MKALSKIKAHLGEFIGWRVVCFIGALLMLVGFQLGMLVHQTMAVEAIGKLEDATKAAIAMKYGL